MCISSEFVFLALRSCIRKVSGHNAQQSSAWIYRGLGLLRGECTGRFESADWESKEDNFGVNALLGNHNMPKLCTTGPNFPSLQVDRKRLRMGSRTYSCAWLICSEMLLQMTSSAGMGKKKKVGTATRNAMENGEEAGGEEEDVITSGLVSRRGGASIYIDLVCILSV